MESATSGYLCLVCGKNHLPFCGAPCDKTTASLSTVFIVNSPQYKWNPLPNITAYELALCLPIILSRGNYYGDPVASLSPEAKRHFEREGG